MLNGVIITGFVNSRYKIPSKLSVVLSLSLMLSFDHNKSFSFEFVSNYVMEFSYVVFNFTRFKCSRAKGSSFTLPLDFTNDIRLTCYSNSELLSLGAALTSFPAVSKSDYLTFSAEALYGHCKLL